MRRILAAAVVVAGWLGVFAPGAAAQTYYLGVRGGYGLGQNTDTVTGAAAGPRTTFDPGYAAALASGMQWIDGWRFEGELSWRRNDYDTAGGVATVGTAEAWAATLNFYYRFLHERSLTPYLGGGAGVARLAISDLPVGAATVDDWDVAAAWQVMAGVDLTISPAVVVSLEYRYFDAGVAKLTDSLGTEFRTRYRNSGVMLGVSWGF